jgi:ATP synthase protein I
MKMRTQLRGAAIAWAVCLVQIGVLGIAALLTGAIWGRPQAIASAYGGLVALMSTAYFAFYALIRSEGKTPQQAVGTFYRGEVGKFVLTAALFAIGTKLFAQEFVFLMLTFVVCQLVYWPALGMRL